MLWQRYESDFRRVALKTFARISGRSMACGFHGKFFLFSFHFILSNYQVLRVGNSYRISSKLLSLPLLKHAATIASRESVSGVLG
jgi:hypothetical protein